MHRRILMSIVWLLGCPLAAAAQEAGWDGEVELGANYLFGNVSQTLVASRLGLAHADSTWEKGAAARFAYGRAEDADGDSRLTHRSWLATATAGYLPFATLSYIAQAGVESSFERLIDARYTAGGGVRYAVVRSPTSLVDASLSLLAEKTTYDEDVADLDPEAEDVLARLAALVRARRTMGEDRIILESETGFRPDLGDFDNYLVTTINSIAYKLSERIGLKLSLVDSYDSRAEDRGAESNNDGQLFFSLLGTF